MEWHSRKARQNKLRFRQFQIITLIASAIIPIINVVPIGGDVETGLISSIIGGIIVVVT
jgi:hypothetical protein